SGYSKLLGQLVELAQVGHEDGDADAYRGTLRGDFFDANRRPLRRLRLGVCSTMGQRRAKNRDQRGDERSRRKTNRRPHPAISPNGPKGGVREGPAGPSSRDI